MKLRITNLFCLKWLRKYRYSNKILYFSILALFLISVFLLFYIIIPMLFLLYIGIILFRKGLKIKFIRLLQKLGLPRKANIIIILILFIITIYFIIAFIYILPIIVLIIIGYNIEKYKNIPKIEKQKRFYDKKNKDKNILGTVSL